MQFEFLELFFLINMKTPQAVKTIKNFSILPNEQIVIHKQDIEIT